jgi:hypothetical protein
MREGIEDINASQGTRYKTKYLKAKNVDDPPTPSFGKESQGPCEDKGAGSLFKRKRLVEKGSHDKGGPGIEPAELHAPTDHE